MFSPFLLALAYLSATFLLGVLLGWVLWKFRTVSGSASPDTEVQFWKDRSEQSRLELSLEQDKLTALRTERDKLKRQLRSA